MDGYYSRSHRNYEAAHTRDRGLCVYCGADATCVDHVLPVAYCGDEYSANRLSNLASSCDGCNFTAHDFLFDSLEDKRLYILRRRDLLVGYHLSNGNYVVAAPLPPSPPSLPVSKEIVLGRRNDLAPIKSKPSTQTRCDVCGVGISPRRNPNHMESRTHFDRVAKAAASATRRRPGRVAPRSAPAAP